MRALRILSSCYPNNARRVPLPLLLSKHPTQKKNKSLADTITVMVMVMVMVGEGEMNKISFKLVSKRNSRTVRK